MACEHDPAEMDTAAHWDGLCPLCLTAENERLRKQLGIAMTALRRINSLADKNVPKYAQEISREALNRDMAMTAQAER